MKKYFICFSLFTFCFLLSTLHAQDTLVLRNGQKIGVKIISVTDKIIYSIPPSDNPLFIKGSKVSYIKYRGGYIYTVNYKYPPDTVKPTFDIGVSSGVSLPFNSGYGGWTYTADDIGYGYSGYAYTGTIFSAAAELEIYHGWGLMGSFSKIRNQFDATQVMNETAYLFINDNNQYANIQNVRAGGNYYYTNYSYLLGVVKNWGKKIRFGVSLMMGEFITYTPALHGDAVVNYYNSNYTNTTTANDYLNINSLTQKNFVFELGFHGDLNITHHIFLRGLLEFQSSGLTNGGGYQVVDIGTGNTIYSGTYTGSGDRNTNLFVGLFNTTIGVGYKF